MGDQLKELNDELRGQADAAGPWLPLESNPAVFTSFSRRVGLPEPWEWQDVLGFEPELLALTPRPVAAVILLFPCTESIYRARAKESHALQTSRPTEAAVGSYHLKQVASFGNACGTIAAVHALVNADIPRLTAETPIRTFRDQTADKTPIERGRALLATKYLKDESDGAAEHRAAQTACPSRDGPALDHHYCAFVPVVAAGTGAAHVVELDGTKAAAVDHGPVAAGSFLESVTATIRAKFFSVEPGSLEFSLMALCCPNHS